MHGLFIINGGYEVCIADVMNPWNVFVADTFNAMLTESELQQGRTLQRFGGDDAQPRVLCAQIIASSNSAGGASGANVGRQATSLCVVLAVNLFDYLAGHLVVPDGIAEFLELVEDDDIVAAFFTQLPALVVDLFDV